SGSHVSMAATLDVRRRWSDATNDTGLPFYTAARPLADGMNTSSGVVCVKAVEDRRAGNDWLRLPFAIYADDPAWVAPLALQEKRRVSAKHNPFFTFGVAQRFIAYRDGRPVGRISAQINRRHLERYHDATGHFGFFDCADDAPAAGALVRA